MISFLNRCIWSSLTTGLADFSIGAAAQNGYIPSQCLDPIASNGATYHYVASNDLGQHEEGDGVYNSGPQTLTRITIRNSSNGGSKVNFTDYPTVIMGGPIATDLGSSGGMSIGGAVVSGTPGSVLFVGTGPVLAQDNVNFFWDDTNFNLSLDGSATGQGILKIQGQNAFYRVPNGSGDNWFEGSAGNLTVTGKQNFGTGQFCLVSLTTGSGNVGLGDSTLFACDVGSNNFSSGQAACGQLTSGSQNVGIGFAALRQCSTGSQNMAIGSEALFNATGSANLGIGFGAALSLVGGNNNTFIGPFLTGQNITSGSNNTIIGLWNGPAGALSNVIALTDGAGSTPVQGVDFNFTTSGVWSFQKTTIPIGHHIYNIADTPLANYERGVLDWNITTNVFTIGTQAGGTGSARNLEFIIGSVNKLDYGITNAGLWTFAQAMMFATSVSLTNGAAAQLATLTNGPTAGNPTKWVPINDNGTTRFIPAW